MAKSEEEIQPGSEHRSPEPTPTGENGAKGFGFSEKKIRMAFIRKVYSILMVQLLATLGIMFIFMFPAKEFMLDNFYVLYISSGVMMLILIIWISCFPEARRKTPLNYILLFSFTIVFGFFISTSTAYVSPESFAFSVGITAVICFSLTCFAFQTKWDFTGWGAVLYALLMCLIIFAFSIIFFTRYHPDDLKIWRLVFSTLGAFLFSCYLIYDTQVMIGGKHKYSISPEEYVVAALNLYLDVINIFLSILGLSR